MELMTTYNFSKLLEELPTNIEKTRNRPNVSGGDPEYIKRHSLDNKGNKIDVNGNRYKINKRYPSYGNKMESMTLGVVKQIFKKNGKYVPSKLNLKYPKLYKELSNAISAIDPDFKWDSCTINHNAKCFKHRDGRNVGESIIVSLGDYMGGNLKIYDKEDVNYISYDIKNKPVKFNGSLLSHETEDFIGNRWSLIWYKKLKV